MKRDDLIRALGQADDRFVEEAAPGGRRNRKYTVVAAVAACAACLLLVLNLWLFIPFSTTPPDVSAYADSDYYPIIQKLNEATFERPRYKNNFVKLINGLQKGVENMMGGVGMDSALGDASGMAPGLADSDQRYEETTDNQVAGVIEGDLIKRSDKYIYYLYRDTLKVYSIKGEDSSFVSELTLSFPDSNINSYWRSWTIYLSEDCRTVTVVAPHYERAGKTAQVSVISLDVSDPAAIKETNRVSVTGGLLSSRVIQGKLLLLTQFAVTGRPDFSDESTFLPQIRTGTGMESIPVDNIHCPEDVTNTRYTVVCRLDGSTLALEGSTAFLSYSEEVYVSADHVFVTRAYTDTEEQDGGTLRRTMTEISCVAYNGDALEYKGSVAVAGYVKDQYSLDEYEGVLRVATTTDTTFTYTHTNNDTLIDDSLEAAPTVSAETGTSASLYCIDMTQWKVIASVEEFAPRGETVRSVRFDGTAAYVCTAIQVTDPVFFFDLSDLNNITYKDTGSIEGFSTSLVNLGNGKLLGIGVGGSGSGLKLEIYEESADGVVSICAYEKIYVEYSTDYKAYLIDRENQLVGLGYTDYGMDEAGASRYVLLQFDGYELRELLDVPLEGENALKRATIADTYLYLLSGDSLVVENLL